jgi:chemotaxis signal transduction protein
MMNFTQADRSPQPRTEQIILFRISGQTFAISSASVQEVRGVDHIAGMAQRPSRKQCAQSPS